MAMKRLILWAVLLAAGLALLASAGIGRLIQVDQTAPYGSAEQRDAHHTLHYWGHLVIGRALQVCPCSRRQAYWEYYKARFHAATPRQRALITTQIPHSLPAAARDAVVVGWLGVNVVLADTAVRLLGVALLAAAVSGAAWQWRAGARSL
jgi:hypothetical protein